LYLEKLDAAEMQKILRAIEEMKKEGIKDLLGEGIRPEGVTYTAELELSTAGRDGQSIRLPDSALRGEKELLAFLASPVGGASDCSIDVARVQLRKSMGKHSFIKRTIQGADAGHARKGSRGVAWGSANGEAVLYNWEALQPGNRLEGCAILEGVNSTYFVPAGWTMEMDAYGNGILRNA
jgi:N-methylhydantoinase A/oxoprolinase/acetone carboxylase beta subunit